MSDPTLVEFERWLGDTYAGDSRFGGVHRVSGGDMAAGVRLEVAESSHYEVAALTGGRAVRVGFLTADRALNESIEQGILDSGDTLDEWLEAELEDLGEAPASMEHFFERPFFCYVTTLPLATPEALGSPDVRGRVRHLIDACYTLFQDYLEG
jgi:hypothetical protein